MRYMPGIVKVAAVSFRPEIRNMLHRYVGGILKDIAVVKPLSPEEAMESQCDLYIVYTQGTVFTQLSKKIEVERLIAVNLYPLPVGMKKVLMIPQGSRVGVLAGHVWCAADFLGQLIDTGFRNYYFSTGTPEIGNTMNVDYFVVPEEIAPYIDDPDIKKKLVIVPRGLDARSVSKIIGATLKIKTMCE